MAITVDQMLRRLADAIVAGDHALFGDILQHQPSLAAACFTDGATRQETPATHFLQPIGQYIYAGDTALHVAAAAHRPEMTRQLIQSGADVRARNRRGGEPLHAAAAGSPGSAAWDPAAQVATIACLVEAGADPNARNMDLATPLHRAVRTRAAAAVEALLHHGADPAVRNRNGSTAFDLASRTTGRSGSGSPAAKEQQQEILRLLQRR